MAMLLSGEPSLAQLFAGSGTAGSCPYIIRERLEIVDILFVTEVAGDLGNRMAVPEERLNEFRIALVHVRVRKPPGAVFRLPAAALSLHYRTRSGFEEVAPCEGISQLVTSADADAPIRFPPFAGPGWVKQLTGPRASQADTVYFYAVFDLVEPDVSEVWLCISQPAQPQPFRTNGWSDNE